MSLHAVRLPRGEGNDIALSVLGVIAGIEALLAADEIRRHEAARDRRCCRVCGSLIATPTCDVCRARLEAAS